MSRKQPNPPAPLSRQDRPPPPPAPPPKMRRVAIFSVLLSGCIESPPRCYLNVDDVVFFDSDGHSGIITEIENARTTYARVFVSSNGKGEWAKCFDVTRREGGQ